jgi:acyl-coenzyme A thioesterase PaaI-like protein
MKPSVPPPAPAQDTRSPAPPGPPSAAQLAAELGSLLPAAEAVAPESFELVDAVRDLVEAVVLNGADPEELAEVTRMVRQASARLGRDRRADAVWLVRHRDGRVEHLTQAGSGRLNPQAPPLVFERLPVPPAGGSTDPAAPLEIVARCRLTAAHGGGPGRVHGSVVAGMLDEVLGVAATAAGASGLTVALEVRFRRATPYGVPLEIVGRFTGSEGRKSFAAGEVRADGIVTAEAKAVFVAAPEPLRAPDASPGHPHTRREAP